MMRALAAVPRRPQGRFFAGREVRADFFDEERFEAAQLAPQEGEFS